MNQFFYIQYNSSNGFITTISQKDHSNDPAWVEVAVPKFELNAFKQNYNKCKYDVKSGAWLPPQDFIADTDLSPNGESILSNLQDQLNQLKQEGGTSSTGLTEVKAQINQLQSKQGSILSQLQTQANSLSAQGKALAKVNSDMGTNLQQYETVTSANSAHNSLAGSVSAYINSANSTFSSLNNQVTTDNSNELNSLNGDVNSLQNAVNSAVATTNTDNNADAGVISSLSGALNSASSAIASTATSYASASTSVDTAVNSIATSLTNANQSMGAQLKKDLSNNMSIGNNTFSTDANGDVTINGRPIVTAAPAGAPAAPGLTATANNGTLSYSITAPNDDGGSQISEYEIQYAPVDASRYSTITTTQLQGTINGLDAKQKYNVYAYAINSIGKSNPSAKVTTQLLDTSVYGVRSSGGSDPTMTRTDASVDLTAGIGGDQNDFDHRGPWAKFVTKYDSDGNKFIGIPKCYIRKTKTGSGNNAVYTWQVSLKMPDNGPETGWYRPKCFWDYNNQVERPYIYVGAYDASDNGAGGLASKSNTSPLVNVSMNDFRTKATSMGNNCQLLDYHIWDVIRTLMLVEFNTFDLAAKFGIDNTGNKNYSIQQNGVTDGLDGSSSSDPSANVMNYRGIENVFTNVFQWCDGVSQDTNYNIWLCDNPQNYQSNLFSAPYQQTAENIQSGGWVSELDYDPQHPEFTEGINFSGANNTYMCVDAGFNYGSNGYSAFSVGGAFDYAYFDGAFGGSDGGPTSTYSDIGSRLVKQSM